MKATRLIATFAVPAIVALGLAGCGDGTDPASGSALSACISGKTWNLDVNDMATQLGAELSAKNIDVRSSTGEGTETITFSRSGHSTSTNDLTYTIVAALSNGLAMSIAQKHTGDAGGDWTLTGSTVKFTHWDAGTYVVNNSFRIGDVVTSAPLTVPDSGLGGVDLVVTCHGNSLTTKAAVSPFTQHWTAG